MSVTGATSVIVMVIVSVSGVVPSVACDRVVLVVTSKSMSSESAVITPVPELIANGAVPSGPRRPRWS